MTPEQQIKAIAELDGFKNPQQKKKLIYCDDATEPGDVEITVWVYGKDTEFEPNYLHSRDAIVPVIEKQKNIGDFNQKFQRALNFVLLRDHQMDSDDTDIDWLAIYYIVMTPSQLCEALLRATGKWIE